MFMFPPRHAKISPFVVLLCLTILTPDNFTRFYSIFLWVRKLLLLCISYTSMFWLGLSHYQECIPVIPLLKWFQYTELLLLCILLQYNSITKLVHLSWCFSAESTCILLVWAICLFRLSEWVLNGYVLL